MRYVPIWFTLHVFIPAQSVTWFCLFFNCLWLLLYKHFCSRYHCLTLHGFNKMALNIATIYVLFSLEKAMQTEQWILPQKQSQLKNSLKIVLHSTWNIKSMRIGIYSEPFQIYFCVIYFRDEIWDCLHLVISKDILLRKCMIPSLYRHVVIVTIR